MLIHMSIRRVAKCVGGHRLCRVLTTAKAPHGPSGLIAVTNLLKISVFLVLFGIDLKEISDDLSPMKSTDSSRYFFKSYFFDDCHDCVFEKILDYTIIRDLI